MRTIKQIKRLLGVSAFLTLAGTTLRAQPFIVGPSNPENPMGNYSTLDPYVNADMLVTPSGGKLHVVAWYNGNGDTEVRVWDDVGGVSVFNMTNARFVDVALANNLNNPGDYYAVFVYKVSNKTFLETYTITGVGSSSITTAPDSLVVLSNAGGFPFIDMFADPNNQLFGMPSMHQYVFTWGDYDPINGNVLYASFGDVSAPSIYDSTQLASSTTSTPIADVGVSADYNSGDQTAYFAIQDNVAATLDLGEIDYSVSPPSASTPVFLSVDSPYIARIEAMGLTDAGVTAEPWTVVAPLINASSNYDMYFFNPTNLSGGGFNCTQSTSALYGNNWCTAIAAGLGGPFAGSYANSNYTLGWHAYTNNLYVTQAEDMATGSINTSMPDYYQVNNNPVGKIPGKIPMALTSTSNAGKELLTVWYDGNNTLFYKETGDVTGYKPTGIEGVSKEAAFSLYPNPARNNINVTMGNGLTFESIRIINMLGQSVYYNQTSASGAVLDLSGFAPGLYQVEVHTKQGKESKAFIVQ